MAFDHKRKPDSFEVRDKYRHKNNTDYFELHHEHQLHPNINHDEADKITGGNTNSYRYGDNHHGEYEGMKRHEAHSKILAAGHSYLGVEKEGNGHREGVDEQLKEDQPSTVAPTSIATGQFPTRQRIYGRTGRVGEDKKKKKFKETYVALGFGKNINESLENEHIHFDDHYKKNDSEDHFTLHSKHPFNDTDVSNKESAKITHHSHNGNGAKYKGLTRSAAKEHAEKHGWTHEKSMVSMPGLKDYDESLN